jgi:hypothetical protein
MGINRASMNETSRRASIGRFMTGRAALLPATQTGMSNFDDGTVGRSMATSGAIWEGQSGINRAAALQRKLAMGGKLSVDDLELGKEGMGRIDMFLASDDGQRAREAILRAKQARALGDEKGAEAELDRARGLLESGVYDKRRYDEKLGIYVGDSASMRNTYRNSGLTDRYLAAAMIKSGDASGAAAIAGKGEVTSNAYGDVKAAQTRAIDALEKAGVESGLAKQLAGGGVGAELFIKTAGNATLAEQGRSHEALTRLAMSPRVAAMLSDVSPDSDEYFEILSQEASKKFGGSFSGEDVRAVMQAESQVRSSWHGIGASYIRGDRDEIQGILSSRFARAGKETLSSIDTRTALSAIRSAGTALGGASEEMKAALGDEYGRAVKGLARVGSGEKLGSAEMLRVQGHLDALLARAGEAGVGGMLGGQELGLLAEKRSKALSAARSGEAGSLQSIAQAYGLRGSDAELIAQIEGMGIQGINKDQQLTVEEMESAVRNLASQDLLGSLSAGEGGGIFLRGMTHEQQVAFDMQRTAASVQKMAEAVDAFHTKVFNPDEKTQKPAGK